MLVMMYAKLIDVIVFLHIQCHPELVSGSYEILTRSRNKFGMTLCVVQDNIAYVRDDYSANLPKS